MTTPTTQREADAALAANLRRLADLLGIFHGGDDEYVLRHANATLDQVVREVVALKSWVNEEALRPAATDQPSVGPDDARPLLVRAREALDYCVKALSSLGITENSRRFAMQNASEVIADIDQPSAGQVDEQNADFPHCLNRTAFISDLTYQMYLAEIEGYTRPTRASLTPTAPQAASQQAGCENCDGNGQWLSGENCIVCGGTGAAPQAATTASAISEGFTEWLAREMPAGTVISDPAWWAPRILRAALARAPLPAQQDGAVDVARDAARPKGAMPAGPQSIRPAPGEAKPPVERRRYPESGME